MPKTVLITGIIAQDGAYLAEFVLGKGFAAHGIERQTSLFNTDRIDHPYEVPHVADRWLVLHHGDRTDSSNLVKVIQQVQPDDACDLGVQSHVAVSFEEPECAANLAVMGALSSRGHPDSGIDGNERSGRAVTKTSITHFDFLGNCQAF